MLVAFSHRQVALLALVATVLGAAVGVLLFGPARGARDDIGSVRSDLHGSRQAIGATLGTARTDAVQAGTALARTTLTVAQQTLRTGKQALTTATDTLQTLTTSLDVQRQQLAVAQQTLEQTREINRKIPGTVAPLPGS